MNQRIQCRVRLWSVVLTSLLLMGIVGAISRAQGQPVADTSSVFIEDAVKIKPAKAEPRQKSPTWAMVRSAVFPGWGQYYTEHYVKSGLFFCLEAGFIVAALVEDSRARDVYHTDYDTYLQRIDKRNGYIWWTVGVVAYSMLDAYVDAHLFDFDRDAVNIDIEPSQNFDGARISLRVSFADFP